MTARDLTAERTRDALLDAGLEVAEDVSLAGMSVNRIVAAAGVAKGTFYVHFPDRSTFLSALHQRFHDHITRAVKQAIDGLAPGRERLRRGMRTYLDACLHARGVKALLLEARNDEAVGDQVASRNDAFAQLAAPDLRAMGWHPAAPAARLLIAMAAETALVELPRARADTASRRVLWQMLDRLDLAGG
ncbi:TetR/AcrR family transcriptional regulator [Amycolatopsis sp. FDAARGOS 1241]|uniref:TetR/AcrR family transcriptional regulator n=1 Tax=Amycolatopsis sp. FDAARGOS 1241 TaxID=2778070 RepID=UPI0019506100|nr:TetR/AcrR family transcriptional regulator [Amycolatopsis sp. FDAARGOS 1241]QRP50088.1 TetR/AcrR family transcriptional regulator [Amycolatopsis sp. FDAARGOS 1241]